MSASLATYLVGDANAPRTAWFIHGILGNGRNLRALAAALVDASPGWRAVLIDLRHHGESGPDPSSPPDAPNDLRACAADLSALTAEWGDPHLVAGHSFGGKVALAFARDQRHPALRDIWVLDATPGLPNEPPNEANNDVLQVLGAMRRAPLPADSRNAVIAWLEADGFTAGLARWLVTNLERTGSGWSWRPDLAAVDELLADYFRQDLLPFLHQPRDYAINIVRAGRSDRWDPAEVAEIQSLPTTSRTTLHTLANAGHWVHVDDPDGLIALMSPTFSVGDAGSV